MPSPSPSSSPSPSVEDARRETVRFETLLDAAERVRVARLAFDELAELGRLYRKHASRLARLRSDGDDPDAIRHLNALCVRAHTLLYVPSGIPDARAQTFAAGLRDAIARTWRAHALAWSLLAAGLLLGAALGARDVGALHAFIPASMGYDAERIETLAASPQARAEFLAPHSPDHPLTGWNVVFGSSLFVHNTRVGLLAFAAGVLGGVPTVILQLYNGILLGAFASIFLRDPVPLPFLAWILPHGIPELTAITCCAAAGLVLGGAVALPGRSGRAAALRAAVEPALLLLGAALPLFALAALAESFVRESTLSVGARLAVAAAMAAALVAASLRIRHLARGRGVDTTWLRDVIAPRHRASPGTGSAPTP